VNNATTSVPASAVPMAQMQQPNNIAPQTFPSGSAAPGLSAHPQTFPSVSSQPPPQPGFPEETISTQAFPPQPKLYTFPTMSCQRQQALQEVQKGILQAAQVAQQHRQLTGNQPSQPQLPPQLAQFQQPPQQPLLGNAPSQPQLPPQLQFNAQPQVQGSSPAAISSQVKLFTQGLIAQEAMDKQKQLIAEGERRRKAEEKRIEDAKAREMLEAAELAARKAADEAKAKLNSEMEGVVLPGERSLNATRGSQLQEINGQKLEQMILQSAVKDGSDVIPLTELQERFIPTQINMVLKDPQYMRRFQLTPRNEVRLVPLKGEYEMYICQETLARIITNPKEWAPFEARKLIARAACCVMNLPDINAFVRALAKVCDKAHPQCPRNRMCASLFVDAVLHIAYQTDDLERRFRDIVQIFEPHLFANFFSHVPPVLTASTPCSPEYAITLRLIAKRWYNMKVYGRDLYDRMVKAVKVEVEGRSGPSTGGIWETLVVSISADRKNRDFYAKPWEPTMQNFKDLKPKVSMAAAAASAAAVTSGKRHDGNGRSQSQRPARRKSRSGRGRSRDSSRSRAQEKRSRSRSRRRSRSRSSARKSRSRSKSRSRGRSEKRRSRSKSRERRRRKDSRKSSSGSSVSKSRSRQRRRVSRSKSRSRSRKSSPPAKKAAKSSRKSRSKSRSRKKEKKKRSKSRSRSRSKGKHKEKKKRSRSRSRSRGSESSLLE